MYAVVRTGGKQYRVVPDDRITVERLAGEPGGVLELGDVLMIGEPGKPPTVGTPVLEKARVFAEVLEQSRGDKIIVFKKKRRKNYRRKQGHRQELTLLRITDISPNGAKPKAKVKGGAKAKAGEEEKPKKAAKAKSKEEAVKDKPRAGKVEATSSAEVEASAKGKKSKVASHKKAPAKKKKALENESEG